VENHPDAGSENVPGLRSTTKWHVVRRHTPFGLLISHNFLSKLQ
jgi:hypothetical protein